MRAPYDLSHKTIKISRIYLYYKNKKQIDEQYVEKRAFTEQQF